MRNLFDVLGFIPGLGEIFDLANGGIYLARGDGFNAALSAGSAIPFAGWFAGGIKVVGKGADAAKFGAKYGDDVAEGIAKGVRRNADIITNPNNIRFTQDSISATFKNGTPLDTTIKGLRNGTISPDSFPTIKTFMQDGLTYFFDNRRLYVFQQAGIDSIKTIPATADEIANEMWKFTTNNNGASIRVRRGINK